MLCYPEDLALVLPHELLKSCRVSRFRARYKRYIRMDLFRRWRLDGWHMQKGAKNSVLRADACTIVNAGEG